MAKLSKKEMRKQIIAARDNLNPEKRQDLSRAVANNLFSLPQFQKARTIMFFLSFGSEVNTLPMVAQALKLGKQVVVPKTYPKEKKMEVFKIDNPNTQLIPGVWGIPEPDTQKTKLIDPQEIDLVIVPGSAFDRQGNRLGYGGGYYDRFFPRLRPEVPLVAIAFSLQLVASVPVEPWDRQMDILVTENQILYF